MISIDHVIGHYDPASCNDLSIIVRFTPRMARRIDAAISFLVDGRAADETDSCRIVFDFPNELYAMYSYDIYRDYGDEVGNFCKSHSLRQFPGGSPIPRGDTHGRVSFRVRMSAIHPELPLVQLFHDDELVIGLDRDDYAGLRQAVLAAESRSEAPIA